MPSPTQIPVFIRQIKGYRRYLETNFDSGIFVVIVTVRANARRFDRHQRNDPADHKLLPGGKTVAVFWKVSVD